MNKFAGISLIVLALAISAFSQKLGKPTLTPSPLTPSQQKTLQEGVKLHDEKKYEEAVAKYKSILVENPECVAAMYELALTLEHKGEKLASMELANKGTKYLSDELPLFYVLIANNLDDLGKPDDAVKIYLDGIKLLEGNKDLGSYRASLEFNLGVTYIRQKKFAEARKILKDAVEDNYAYPSPHFLLSYVYHGTKYKIPAFLAAARFVSLEYSTQRTGTAVGIITDVLKPAAKDPKTGNINIFMDLNAPKDEGDFGMFDLLLGTLTTVRGDDDKGKSDNQMFIDAIGSIIAILSEDKKMRSTFIGKNYLPFMTELKKNGHLDALGNMILYIRDTKNADAARWVADNDAKLSAFLNWAKAYQLPAK
ncbi:MAG: tetratricopeptide repeat protein [Pyrinomonadaceae bacterium]